MKRIFMIIIIVSFVSHCGDTTVNIDENTYDPKIVIDGFLVPGQQVENIRITRNYAINKEIKLDEFFIADARVMITDLDAGVEYDLTLNPVTLSYDYTGTDLVIAHGNSYRLDVAATIDGVNLATSSVTTVPQPGLAIVAEDSRLQPMTYRQRDESGDLITFSVVFQQSPGTNAYVLSIVALDAAESTFIEDNPFELKKEDLKEDNTLEWLKHQSQWAQKQTNGASTTEIEILWYSIWFYGKYRAILYAMDDNLKDYYLTHQNIQDIDGNLWEPKFHFSGDGIGVFGSTVTDTVYFEVLKN